jgi:iron complex outermembrane recepter protein
MQGLLRAALVAAVLASAWSASAKESDGSDIAVRVDIPSLTLVEALNLFALQTGLQLIVPYGVAGGVLERGSPPIRRAGTAREVLDAMLAGTSLRYTFINARTISVHEAREPKVVKVEDLNFDEVVITGSRIPYDLRADSRPDTTAPVTIFDREQIDALGVSDITSLLRYLPQQPYGPRTGFAAPSFAGLAEMRGLGFDTTLILINGRRIGATGSLIAWNAFDLNTVPLSAVERIEVLSDSASAVYGADAIGGVVNIILKREIRRPVIDLHYGTADGGAAERRASLSAGHSGHRFRASLSGDYFERTVLLGAERHWANQDYRTRGGRDERITASNPGNVSSLSGGNLPSLPSPFAAVPVGSHGALIRADFLNTAGAQNKESSYRYWAAIPASERVSLTAFADFDVTPNLNLFNEAHYGEATTRGQYEPATRRLIVPANNPFNPFGEAVAVDYMFTDLGPTRVVMESQFDRLVAGLRGKTGKWDWEVSMLRNQELSTYTTTNSLNDARVNAALRSSDPDRTLNVFHDGPAADAELLESLSVKTKGGDYASALLQAATVARGKLGRLPAGNVTVVLGSEWSRSDVRMIERFGSVDSYRTVVAAFGEVRAPIVSSDMQIPSVRELVVAVSARADHYRGGFGTSFNPQYGVTWRLIDEVLLRGSYASSFRAPSLFELFTPRTVIPDIPIPDPSRNGQFSSVTFVTGGNPDLRPIEADSLTAGFVLTPNAIPNFQATAGYWRVNMRNRVQVIPYDVLIASEERFPLRVERSERTAADITAGLPGALTYLDISRINFGSILTDGIDFGAKYSFETRAGELSADLAATWVNAYDIVDIPGTVGIDRVAVADPAGSISRWRGMATIGLTNMTFRVSLTARYTSGYLDTDVFTGESLRRIAGMAEFDIQGAADLGMIFGGRFDDTVLTAGISNLLNKEPPFAQVGGQIGFDPTQGDLRGRFGYLRLSKGFQ